MKDTDLLNARLTKVQQDYDQQLLSCDQLATENTQKAAELKAKEDEINALKQDTVRLTKMREAIQRKLRTIEDQKMEVEQQKETLKGQIAGLEKGMRNDGVMDLVILLVETRQISYVYLAFIFPQV